jgi:hypothetical protein
MHIVSTQLKPIAPHTLDVRVPEMSFVGQDFLKKSSGLMLSVNTRRRDARGTGVGEGDSMDACGSASHIEARRRHTLSLKVRRNATIFKKQKHGI